MTHPKTTRPFLEVVLSECSSAMVYQAIRSIKVCRARSPVCRLSGRRCRLWLLLFISWTNVTTTTSSLAFGPPQPFPKSVTEAKLPRSTYNSSSSNASSGMVTCETSMTEPEIDGEMSRAQSGRSWHTAKEEDISPLPRSRSKSNRDLASLVDLESSRGTAGEVSRGRMVVCQ